MLSKYGIRVTHKPTDLCAKDPLKDEEKSGVVYRVNCEECSSLYVGENTGVQSEDMKPTRTYELICLRLGTL